MAINEDRKLYEKKKTIKYKKSGYKQLLIYARM